MIIGIDFDGTITETNEYPKIGSIASHCISVIKKWQKQGHKCFLWTCRTGKLLQDAKECLEKSGLELDGYNESPTDGKIEVGEIPRKAFADIYIDDRSFPQCAKTKIDWLEIDKILQNWKNTNIGFIEEKDS